MDCGCCFAYFRLLPPWKWTKYNALFFLFNNPFHANRHVTLVSMSMNTKSIHSKNNVLNLVLHQHQQPRWTFRKCDQQWKISPESFTYSLSHSFPFSLSFSFSLLVKTLFLYKLYQIKFVTVSDRFGHFLDVVGLKNQSISELCRKTMKTLIIYVSYRH